MLPEEPLLALDDIQGDIIAGFRKDNVRLVFFQIGPTEVQSFQSWLLNYLPKLATMRQVSGFNAVFKSMRVQLNREPVELSVLWRNIGFTAAGLKKLIGGTDLSEFADTSFLAGAEQLSTTVGDPSDGSPGDSRNWEFGSKANIPDVVIILAADRTPDIDTELTQLLSELAPLIMNPPHVEFGATRASQPGHEHFGYKDGISQPAVRGRNPDGTYCMPRNLEPSDPNYSYFSGPGQQLVWPGEFLLNLAKQKGANADPLQTKVTKDGPSWATNGSYLVFRKLRQSVGAFNQMIENVHAALSADPAFSALDQDQVGAMMVGRFQSGCPFMRTTTDNTSLANDSLVSNNFLFSQDTPPLAVNPASGISVDVYPQAKADTFGVRCPFSSHIRKVNPRDDSTDFGAGQNNLQKRIIRRGIPYGPDFSEISDDSVDRGLLFMSYQASIRDQFEFIMRNWVNRPDHPKDDAGHDAILSSVPGRFLQFKRPDQSPLKVSLPAPVIFATAAAYLFVPSLSSIRTKIATPSAVPTDQTGGSSGTQSSVF